MERFKTSLVRLWQCERGAEGLEKLLIIAAIVLPLLGVLFLFKDWLVEWLGDEANEVRMESENTIDPFN